ncbi:MAG: prolyl oligopeptidase family serine peptidase [Planctomycetaceae bacterium]|nr:prolyl oligopeptidase family serine peptidase [Planctomycetaceae bacterium]
MSNICQSMCFVATLVLITGLQSSNYLLADEPALNFATAQDVVFRAKVDNSDQRYVIVLPEQFAIDKTYSLLIALHGHGSDRWQFVKSPRDECRAARDAATRHGMIFVSPDYRAKTSWMGPAAEADLIQIIANLKTKCRINRVILSGGSMGASSSLSFAAMHPKLIDGIVAMNGTANHLEYENFQLAIQESFGGSKTEVLNQYKIRSAEYWPEQFTMPVGITTGGKDKSVPPDSVLRLASILQKLKHRVLVIHRPETGHSTTHLDATAIYEFVIQQSSKKTK